MLLRQRDEDLKEMENRIFQNLKQRVLPHLEQLKKSIHSKNSPHLISLVESELGVTLLAFSCHDAEPALVDKKILDKIQSVEEKLGLSLVAVNA